MSNVDEGRVARVPVASTSPVVLDSVAGIHAQEAASLYETRMALVRMPHADLLGVERLDDRLLAHFDGLAVAGGQGQRCLDAELDSPSIGAAFAFAVRALEGGRADWLGRLWEAAPGSASVAAGLVAAFGWVEPRFLQGVVRDLLKSIDPTKRAAGLAACAMHRTDPGLHRGPWLGDPDAFVRARALRTAGELGLTGIAASCAAAMDDEDAECRFWAGWSAVLLGRHSAALDAFPDATVAPHTPRSDRAFCLLLLALGREAGHAELRKLGGDSAHARRLIHGSGLNGDPAYVPWLIGQMGRPASARVAGEAFTLITGADLDTLQLWRPQPDDVASGPSDEPEDEDVALDPYEGLMWPDAEKVQGWWAANRDGFQAGQRYFMGRAVTWEHCVQVLKSGCQRQRLLAAQYLCLLRPGTPLFNTSAPAWRQKRLLARM